MSSSLGSKGPEVPSSTLEMAILTADQHNRDPLPCVITHSVVPAEVVRYKLGLLLSSTGLPASIIDTPAFRMFIRCSKPSTER